MTDPRAVAKDVARQLYDVDHAPIPSTGQPNGWDEEWVTVIEHALADAERRGLERAATVVEGRLHRARGPEELRSVYFLRKDEAEWILSAIRAQAQAEQEE